MVKSDYKIYYAPVPVSIVRARSSPLHNGDVSQMCIRDRYDGSPDFKHTIAQFV